MDYLPWLTPAPHDDPLVAAIREQCMGVGAHDATAHGILDLIEDSGHGYGATRTAYADRMRPVQAFAVLAPTGALSSTSLDFTEAARRARAIGGLVAGMAILADHRNVAHPPTLAQPFSETDRS